MEKEKRCPPPKKKKKRKTVWRNIFVKTDFVRGMNKGTHLQQ
jgi:hypothetical protein